MIIARHLKQAGLALFALAALGVTFEAQALGTASGTSITNRATVNYSVSGVGQTAIESSPTGNSTPGATNGANTVFVVDNKVNLTVQEASGAVVTTVPSATNVVAKFTVKNVGNTAQGYLLTPTNVTGGTRFGNTDNTDVTNLRAFVDANGNGTYEVGVDIATNIATLAPDAFVTVLIVSDVPVTAINNQFATVQLAAQTTNAGTATVTTQTAGADNPAVVDVVFADGGAVARDGIAEDTGQYAIQSAALSVAKTSTVISDPFNNATNPKAIPGAIVQYAITVTNTGTSNATGVIFNDPLPANTTFQQGVFTGATDVEVQVGAGAPTRCVAETPTDTNADGCYRDATGKLIVQTPMASATVNTGAANAVTVRFRVAIN
jgi:uncharacterized repeat protein (TIGR01451 family)